MRARARSADSQVQALARAAQLRLVARLRELTPHMAPAALSWMRRLSGQRAPHLYFVSGWGYPLLELPWLLSAATTPRRSAAFDRDLIYASVCGYYCIRLLDDLSDGEASKSPAVWLAPVLQAEFQQPLIRHLGDKPRFWSSFHRYWAESFDATQADATLGDIGLAEFCAISSKKTAAAKVPVAAAFSYYEGLGDVRPWLRSCDLWGRFVQMADDVLDWPMDLKRGDGSTYFLCEARRARRRGETVSAWVRREGLDWGTRLCLGWANELEQRARAAGAPAIVQLLTARRRRLTERVSEMSALLARLSPLSSR